MFVNGTQNGVIDVMYKVVS